MQQNVLSHSILAVNSQNMHWAVTNKYVNLTVIQLTANKIQSISKITENIFQQFGKRLLLLQERNFCTIFSVTCEDACHAYAMSITPIYQ